MAYYLEKFIITIDEKGNEIKTKIPNREIADFVHLHNHLNGLEVKHTPTQVIALEENEVYQDGQVVIDEEYYIKKEEEAKKKEAERIAMLNLTGADVERGIYKAKGMDFDDIIAMVISLQQAQDERVANLDLKALKIELKANNFYRGNPYVDAVGSLLGFTSEQLNKFFEYNDYTYLQVKTDEELPTNEIVDDTTETEVI